MPGLESMQPLDRLGLTGHFSLLSPRLLHHIPSPLLRH
jgi:hypothetical protein